MSKKSIKVSYVAKWLTDKNGKKLPIYKSKSFTEDNVKRYQNCQHKLIKLTKVAEMYLRYLTEHMDKANVVHITKGTRVAFKNHMEKDCGENYKDDTIKKALGQLTKAGLVIKMGARIDYMVNPSHHFKGTNAERKKLLQVLVKEWELNPAGNLNIKIALGLR
jgi:hypothetical protein